MFVRYRTEGVLINKRNQNDFDRLLTFYTKEFGKVSLFAKSIRKEESKLRSGVEPFSLVELEFIEGKIGKTLTDIKVVNPFKNINGNLERVSLAEKVINNLNLLIKGEEKDGKIWNLLKDTLLRIEEEGEQIIYYYFFWNLISSLGYGPNLCNCVKCHKAIEKNFRLSPGEGGVVCPQCSREAFSFEVSLDTIKVIRDLLENKDVNPKDQRSLQSITNLYLSSLLS